MAIDNAKTVLNYQSCKIIANSNATSYTFEPCADDGTPSMQVIPFTEIRQINSSSNVFKEGFLYFEKDEEKELYEALGIKNSEQILSQKEIMDIILNPTKDGLQKFLDIKSSSYFDRIRGIFSAIIQSKSFDISIRVKELIEKRYDEIRVGILQTKLVLNTIQNEKIIDDKKINELEKKLEETQKIIQKMQKQEDLINEPVTKEAIRQENVTEETIDSKKVKKK